MTPPPVPSVQYQGQIHPTYTEQVTAMQTASLGKRIVKILVTLGAALFLGGILYGIGWAGDWTWLKWTGIIAAALIAVGGSIMDAKLQLAPCPYCGKDVGDDAIITVKDENLQVECQNCREWLVSQGGNLRAFTTTDAQEKEAFLAPVYENGRWPQECITCGLPAMRFDNVDKKKFNAGMLLVGSLSVSSAAISNIPYCNAHQDAISLKIENDFPRLVFTDYAARRRYVAINQGKKAKKIK